MAHSFPRLALLLCTLALIPMSCKVKDSGLSDCPPCPNNTQCIDGDCGCPSESHDMGSWCLKKHDNLFVAACLDCPCLDIIGLYLLDIKPETGSEVMAKSLYSIIGPENSSVGTGEGSVSQHFSYYERPDGDSIVVGAIPLPGGFGIFNCPINDALLCEIVLYGKFHGPDTIETKVQYQNCVTDAGTPSNFQKNTHLTFVRKK